MKLADHIRKDHPSSDWKCSKCGSELKDHYSLYDHMHCLHYEGKFACTVEQCHFVTTTRMAVLYHHRASHGKYRCSFDSCGMSYDRNVDLKEHERRCHTGARPFRCKWDGCSYDSTNLNCITQHVRRVHFGLRVTKKKQQELGIVDDRDPRQFFEVIQELLWTFQVCLI